MARSTHHSGQQYTESSLRALGKRVERVSASAAHQHSLQARARATTIRHVPSKTGSGGGQKRMPEHSDHEIQVKYNFCKEQAFPRKLLGFPSAFWPCYLISPTWTLHQSHYHEQGSIVSTQLCLVPSQSDVCFKGCKFFQRRTHFYQKVNIGIGYDFDFLNFWNCECKYHTSII